MDTACSPPRRSGERIQVVGGLVFTEAERSRLRKQLEPGVDYNEGQLDDDLWVLNPVDEGLNYFFNHSCDPNSTGEVIRRDIATGEEVTMDYAIEMDGDYELAPFRTLIWFVGPWNSPVPIAMGWADRGVNTAFPGCVAV